MRAIFMAAAVLALAAPAIAADPVSLGVHGKWAAWRLDEGGGRLCYMHAEPEAERGKYARRGDTYMQVTHRKGKTRNVVSVVAGYSYKSDSEVSLDIDGKETMLFTDGDSAWARDKATDAKLVGAMRAGTKMTVKGTSSRGTLTTDVYSLSGFTAAHKAISQACGVK
jgi:invasion protein IalB